MPEYKQTYTDVFSPSTELFFNEYDATESNFSGILHCQE